MAIEVYCPNGHKLTTGEDRIGLPGKCPRCGAAFRVPQPGERAAQVAVRPAKRSEDEAAPSTEAGARQADGDENHAPAEEPALSAVLAAPAAEGVEGLATGGFESSGDEPGGMIVFLCPNGHKLNGPASLQGRPGKCPHCGATFIIPKEEEQAEPQSLFSDLLQDEQLTAPAEESHAAGDAEADQMEFEFGRLTSAGEADTYLPDAASHPMARLFFRLWYHTGREGTVELFLKGGEMLAPDWFAPRLSRGTHAMFGVQDRDGRYTLTAVEWAAVERVAVRGLQELPEGMFE